MKRLLLILTIASVTLCQTVHAQYYSVNYDTRTVAAMVALLHGRVGGGRCSGGWLGRALPWDVAPIQIWVSDHVALVLAASC